MRVRRGVLLAAIGSETAHLNLDVFSQNLDQFGYVNTRPTVDGRRIFFADEINAHVTTLLRRYHAGHLGNNIWL